MEPSDILDRVDEVVAEGSMWEYETLKDLVRDFRGLRREFEKTKERLESEIARLREEIQNILP
jgi:uncharacterized protein YukE